MNVRRHILTVSLHSLVALAVLVPGIGAAAGAKEVVVCIGNEAAADRWVVAEWKAELGRILVSTGRRLRLAGCDEPGVIQVYFMRAHPSELSALGAARTRGARVLPLLEVYTEPLATLLGTRLPAVLGKAIARVTAHELTHFVSQSTIHTSGGGFAPLYTAGLLMGAPSSYFGIR